LKEKYDCLTHYFEWILQISHEETNMFITSKSICTH
jgi:hypothetical protein